MKLILSIYLLLSQGLFDDNKNDLIIEIEKSLMATCCYSGTVYDHGNKEMENNIAQMVSSGKSRKEIISFYTEQYGERVLAIPKREGFNLLAWIAPMLIGILGISIITIYVNSKNEEIQTTSIKEDEKIPFNEKIETELQSLDK
tara:strand:+ start:2759 stop:3190 length:432 start_codon:yes stop_codon:yes gene_type:complete